MNQRSLDARVPVADVDGSNRPPIGVVEDARAPRSPARRLARSALAGAALCLGIVGGAVAPGQPAQALTPADSVESARNVGVVIGSDDRSPIIGQPAYTQYPTRAIGLVTRDGTSRCTGFLISKDTVVTAGHCVHPGGRANNYYSGLQFWAGRYGGDPVWGSCTPRPNGLYAPYEWTSRADEEYDIATIKLTCSVGNNVGWFGLYPQFGTTVQRTAELQGYGYLGIQWRSRGRVEVVAERQLFHTMDTYATMSGAPVFFPTTATSLCGQTVCAFGVQTTGPHGTGTHATYNHATRITPILAGQLRLIAAVA